MFKSVRFRAMVFYATLQQYVSFTVVVSFIGGENPSTRRNPRPAASH
jgi:hypothetical protein